MNNHYLNRTQGSFLHTKDTRNNSTTRAHQPRQTVGASLKRTPLSTAHLTKVKQDTYRKDNTLPGLNHMDSALKEEASVIALEKQSISQLNYLVDEYSKRIDLFKKQRAAEEAGVSLDEILRKDRKNQHQSPLQSSKAASGNSLLIGISEPADNFNRKNLSGDFHSQRCVSQLSNQLNSNESAASLQKDSNQFIATKQRELQSVVNRNNGSQYELEQKINTVRLMRSDRSVHSAMFDKLERQFFVLEYSYKQLVLERTYWQCCCEKEEAQLKKAKQTSFKQQSNQSHLNRLSTNSDETTPSNLNTSSPTIKMRSSIKPSQTNSVKVSTLTSQLSSIVELPTVLESTLPQPWLPSSVLNHPHDQYEATSSKMYGNNTFLRQQDQRVSHFGQPKSVMVEVKSESVHERYKSQRSSLLDAISEVTKSTFNQTVFTQNFNQTQNDPFKSFTAKQSISPVKKMNISWPVHQSQPTSDKTDNDGATQSNSKDQGVKKRENNSQMMSQTNSMTNSQTNPQNIHQSIKTPFASPTPSPQKLAFLYRALCSQNGSMSLPHSLPALNQQLDTLLNTLTQLQSQIADQQDNLEDMHAYMSALKIEEPPKGQTACKKQIILDRIEDEINRIKEEKGSFVQAVSMITGQLLTGEITAVGQISQQQHRAFKRKSQSPRRDEIYTADQKRHVSTQINELSGGQNGQGNRQGVAVTQPTKQIPTNQVSINQLPTKVIESATQMTFEQRMALIDQLVMSNMPSKIISNNPPSKSNRRLSRLLEKQQHGASNNVVPYTQEQLKKFGKWSLGQQQ